MRCQRRKDAAPRCAGRVTSWKRKPFAAAIQAPSWPPPCRSLSCTQVGQRSPPSPQAAILPESLPIGGHHSIRQAVSSSVRMPTASRRPASQPRRWRRRGPRRMRTGGGWTRRPGHVCWLEGAVHAERLAARSTDTRPGAAARRRLRPLGSSPRETLGPLRGEPLPNWPSAATGQVSEMKNCILLLDLRMTKFGWNLWPP